MNLNKHNIATEKLTLAALLGSIMVIINAMGMGAVPLNFARITILHIPVIVATIVGGLYVGIPLGALFGFISLYNATVIPGVLSECFINPLVSVLPRILIPVFTALAFKTTHKLNFTLRVGIAAATGSLANTVFVLLAMLAFYPNVIAGLAGNFPNAMLIIVGTMFGIGGAAEAVTAVIITGILVAAITKIRPEILRKQGN